MLRVLKTLLLWLLIAALPIQGAAAVIKASCGPRHHSASVEFNVPEHHHSADTTAHNHAFEDATALEKQAQVSDTVTVSKTDQSAKLPLNSFCSACAACCAGAVAPPPTVSLAPTFVLVETAVRPSVESFTGFVPAGPERPPRHASA